MNYRKIRTISSVMVLLLMIFSLILALIISSGEYVPIVARANQLSANTKYVGYSEDMDDELICDVINSDNQLDSNTAITILTHGQGGTAGNWSNNGKDFIYDANSLIEQLRDEIPDSNVYVAQNKVAVS